MDYKAIIQAQIDNFENILETKESLLYWTLNWFSLEWLTLAEKDDLVTQIQAL